MGVVMGARAGVTVLRRLFFAGIMIFKPPEQNIQILLTLEFSNFPDRMLDHNLPRNNGIQLLKKYRSNLPDAELLPDSDGKS